MESNIYAPKIELTVNTFADGRIELQTMSKIEDRTKTILREIMDTKEKAIRDALIALGWTPPGAD